MDGLRTWIEIDTDALRHNYRAFKKYVGGHCRVMAVVKSNAYGHGLMETAETLQDAGADCFAVDSIVEALALRKRGIMSDILVLGHTLKGRFADAASNSIALTIAGMADLKNLRESQLTMLPKIIPLYIHIKIDTGMHRQGFSPSELPQVFEALTVLRDSGTILLDGLYTHLAAAGDPKFSEETRAQIMLFSDIADGMPENKLWPEHVHAAATAGALAHPEAHFDMVRIGIGLYGYWPSRTPVVVFPNSVLKPVLSWKTIVTDIKNFPKNERIGYGFSEKLTRNSRVALLPVGYWHGYRGALSRKAHVLIRGKRAKVLGLVSMDMMSVDVTDIPEAEPEDIATLIGADGSEFVSAHELAHCARTSVYEILTCINPRIRRILVSASQS
ncbi:MAG: alanine racemase [Candidatus Niyogibacteria bacterium]|nr:alanine racemase [Candidatus Niyogibacteria bacterium]